MAKDYYATLGVEKKASTEDIKRAFRKLAQKYHPDKGGGDEARFKEITEAYSVLSDERKRREYDAYGQAFAGRTSGGSSGSSGFGGFDFSQFQQGWAPPGGGGGVEFDIGDIFGDIFGGRGGAGKTPRGRDISIDLEIPFKDAIFGTKRSVLINRVSTCDICQGSGGKPGTELDNCATCNGSGRIHETRRSILGEFTSTRVCNTCEGSGKMPKEECTSCKGHGVRRREVEISVTIPPGIDNGEMIRLTGQGEAIKAGVAGDLYIKLHVRAHAVYHREGANLVMTLPVKLTDALLGSTVSIETLEGKILEVKVPAMKRAEELLRIRGKGVPEGASRGDLIIRLEVALPHKLSHEARTAVLDLQSEGL